ncbi:MAG TPA: mechanosensitive ion channel domain-containing protein [Longimicrobiales bacterium]|nr:mechanosensitive ion channel domain-containing protein [Longimicrobiales bacterium]
MELHAWLPEALQTPLVESAIGLTLLFTLVLLLHVVARRYVIRALHVLVHRSPIQWDQVLYEHRVPHRLSLVIPVIALQVGLNYVPGVSDGLASFLLRFAAASMVLVAALTIDAFLSAAHTLYTRMPMAATRPVKSYVQLAKVFMYLLAGVFIIAAVLDRSPWFFVSGMGAMMAILLLVFRDTLLSLVASVQLTNNDLVRVGDWIEMPQFGADGDVIDIALHTVKVQNWDRTISVIPTHKFLDHSFRNWRGMFEGGGRRIKRAFHINTSTIRFLTDEEIAQFRRFVLLRDYIDGKVAELREANAPWADDPQAIVNARRLTNVGTLRAYIIEYLRNHPQIHPDLTFLVRQLAPTPEGLPIEIYVFTTDTRWVAYEGIQADIFDHILAMVPVFGLKVYQRPSGNDFAAALEEEVPGAAQHTVTV